jgi:hypothetical protein
MDTARLSLRNAPAGKPQFLFVRMAVRTPQTHRKTAPNQIPEFSLYWSLTPELTGAGGPTGPQGTNIGHQNREAMANVGVRVERFVRLGREVEGFRREHSVNSHGVALHVSIHAGGRC